MIVTMCSNCCIFKTCLISSCWTVLPHCINEWLKGFTVGKCHLLPPELSRKKVQEDWTGLWLIVGTLVWGLGGPGPPTPAHCQLSAGGAAAAGYVAAVPAVGPV